MGQMFVKFRTSSGETLERNGLTLAEQTSKRVYLENEDAEGNEPEEFLNGSLQEVRNCEKIGFINFNIDEVETIDSKYIAEPRTESVYLGSVSMAEQRQDQVYVEFDDGHTLTVTGELDRAYTY